MKEQLKDIKAPVEISDFSLYLYWGVIIISILLLAVVIWMLAKKIVFKRKRNRAKEYLEKLNSIDWSNPKEAAYKATYYSRLLATDERRKKLFEQLKPKLDRYKYKKDVDAIDEETRNFFNLYKQVCDESL